MSVTESQKNGALRRFLAVATGAVAIVSLGYATFGPTRPDAHLTEGDAWVDCSVPAARVVTARFGYPCTTGYWRTHVCASPDAPDASALPDGVPGLERLAHQAHDLGPCHTDGGVEWVRAWPPALAPWRAACGPGCDVLLGDGGSAPAPAGNRYLAPGSFRTLPDGGLPQGCFRRPEAEWAGLDGTPPECLPDGGAL